MKSSDDKGISYMFLSNVILGKMSIQAHVNTNIKNFKIFKLVF